MRLRQYWVAGAVALVTLSGAAFADVTVSQSNDPLAKEPLARKTLTAASAGSAASGAGIGDQMASLLSDEHSVLDSLPEAKLSSLAVGPKVEAPKVEAPKVEAAKAAAPKAAVTEPATEQATAKTPAPEPAKAAAPKAAALAAPGAGTTARKRSTFWGAPAAPVVISYAESWLDAQPAASGDAQWECLRTALYFESRGETLRGQFAVAEVILNRVDSGRYPASICGVVQQGGNGACQFSYNCDGYANRMRDDLAIERAGKIARIMMDGAPRALTTGATHFHSRAVRPTWSHRFPQTAAIGAHIFYRQP